MKKTLLIGLGLTLLSACLYSKKLDHPLMDNPAFKIIGDQGYKQDITLEELQGDYDCNLWTLDEEDNQVRANKISCMAQIEENVMSIEWQMNDMDTVFIRTFKLDQGLLYSEEEDPLLISAVKVYPDGHMVDGVGTLSLEDTTEIRFHFQITK